MKYHVALVLGVTVFLAFSPQKPLAAAKAKQPKEWKVPAREAARANPVAADEKSLAAGKKLYAAECLDCHGGRGRGDGPGARDLQLDAPMPDLSDPKMWKQSDGSLFYKISKGREPMPSTEEMTEQQRWHIVNYVRTLAPKPRGGEVDGDQARPAKGN